MRDEDGDRPLSVMSSNRSRGNGQRLRHRKTIFTVQLSTLRQLHSEVLESILCDIKTSARASPGQPALADTLCHEQDGWTRWFQVSCSTHPFFNSVIILPNKTRQ